MRGDRHATKKNGDSGNYTLILKESNIGRAQVLFSVGGKDDSEERM